MIVDFRSEILQVLRKHQQAISGLWATASGRTHIFLGNCPKGFPPANKHFSRHGRDGLKPCALTQVYRSNYPFAEADASQKPEIHEPDYWPWFEAFRLDCLYLASRRTADRAGYPIIWEYDWWIEVENTIEEFAFHLRGLLDVPGNHRLGIFFADSPDMGKLANEFREAWIPFAAKHQLAADPELRAIFFPTRFEQWDDFEAGSSSWRWQPLSCSFTRD